MTAGTLAQMLQVPSHPLCSSVDSCPCSTDFYIDISLQTLTQASTPARQAIAEAASAAAADDRARDAVQQAAREATEEAEESARQAVLRLRAERPPDPLRRVPTTTPAEEPRSRACIIQEPANLVRVLQRLQKTHGAFKLYNVDSTFQLMLRYLPIDDDEAEDPCELTFDICLVRPDTMHALDDAEWTALLALEHEGYVDEADDTPVMFVMDQFSLIAGDPDPSALMEAIDRIHELYSMTICPCRSYFIKDGGEMCTFCQLTCSAEDMAPVTCCVCLATSAQKLMVRQACCGQQLHAGCLKMWHASAGCRSCPLCRHTTM
jgi:hypothetical protein